MATLTPEIGSAEPEVAAAAVAATSASASNSAQQDQASFESEAIHVSPESAEASVNAVVEAFDKEANIDEDDAGDQEIGKLSSNQYSIEVGKEAAQSVCSDCCSNLSSGAGAAVGGFSELQLVAKALWALGVLSLIVLTFTVAQGTVVICSIILLSLVWTAAVIRFGERCRAFVLIPFSPLPVLTSVTCVDRPKIPKRGRDDGRRCLRRIRRRI